MFLSRQSQSAISRDQQESEIRVWEEAEPAAGRTEEDASGTEKTCQGTEEQFTLWATNEDLATWAVWNEENKGKCPQTVLEYT